MTTLVLGLNSPTIPAKKTAPKPTQPKVDVQSLKFSTIDQAKPLFTGGSNSLVARGVGHAEGTRGVDGSKTTAYAGHTDPGNGVWNLGSFSFQHCDDPTYSCSTPDEADKAQLRRLEGQTTKLVEIAQSKGVTLSLEEMLNGIDLINQAPLAGLAKDGASYVFRLQEATEKGLTGPDKILWARVQSYWNPDTNSWDAPGLGNSESGIRHDQNRRMIAVNSVIESNPAIVAQTDAPRDGNPTQKNISLVTPNLTEIARLASKLPKKP